VGCGALFVWVFVVRRICESKFYYTPSYSKVKTFIIYFLLTVNCKYT